MAPPSAKSAKSAQNSGLYSSLPPLNVAGKAKASSDESEALVVLVPQNGQPLIADWPKRANLRKYLSFQLERMDFTGKEGQIQALRPPAGMGTGLIVLVGLGEAAAVQALAVERAGGRVAGILAAEGFTEATVLAGSDLTRTLRRSGLSNTQLAAHMITGVRLAQYKFSKYKSPNPDKKAKNLVRLNAVLPDRALGKTLEPMQALVDGICLTRDLVTEPANVINPTTFARLIREKLEPVGIRVSIIDARQAESMGMGGLIGVGQASVNQPCLVVMEWPGTGKSRKDLKKIPALVGKGITFDTGGYSMKPSQGMVGMKTDMGGAATVVGTLYALALQGAAEATVGIVALAENMVDQTAMRPQDILHMYSGKTVEVLNTDAEGRLVLADALTYVQQHYDPSFIVDLATLTGAIRVALGLEYAGVFVNDETLWGNMQTASRTSGDKVWRMPLDPSFHKMLESDIADLANIAGWHGFGGACTAAAFLEEFVDAGRPWAHMDIAGAVWTDAPKPTVPKGATGYGVRMLVDLITKSNAKPKRVVRKAAAAKKAPVLNPDGSKRGRGRPPKNPATNIHNQGLSASDNPPGNPDAPNVVI